MKKETQEKYFSKNALNIPNAISALRIALAIGTFSTLGMGMPFIAGALFCTAAVTDFIDGKLARKYDCITNIGKSGDALADKILVLPTLALLAATGAIPATVAYITFIRDSLVGVVKETAGKKEGTIGASQLGRAKTAVTMTGIGGLLLSSGLPSVIGAPLGLVSTGLIWGGTALCVASGAHYVYKYRDIFKTKKSEPEQVEESEKNELACVNQKDKKDVYQNTNELTETKTVETHEQPIFNNGLYTVEKPHTKIHNRRGV